MRFAQPRWSISRNFTARGAPKIFGNFAIFFARVRRKMYEIPTLDTCFFGSECNFDSVNSRRRRRACTATAHAGRVHAFFCARGVPDFQKFCNFLQDFCTKFASPLDAELSRHLALQIRPTRKRAATKLCALRNHAGRVVRYLYVRGAPKIFGN